MLLGVSDRTTLKLLFEPCARYTLGHNVENLKKKRTASDPWWPWKKPIESFFFLFLFTFVPNSISSCYKRSDSTWFRKCTRNMALSLSFSGSFAKWKQDKYYLPRSDCLLEGKFQSVNHLNQTRARVCVSTRSRSDAIRKRNALPYSLAVRVSARHF